MIESTLFLIFLCICLEIVPALLKFKHMIFYGSQYDLLDWLTLKVNLMKKAAQMNSLYFLLTITTY